MSKELDFKELQQLAAEILGVDVNDVQLNKSFAKDLAADGVLYGCNQILFSPITRDISGNSGFRTFADLVLRVGHGKCYNLYSHPRCSYRVW